MAYVKRGMWDRGLELGDLMRERLWVKVNVSYIIGKCGLHFCKRIHSWVMFVVWRFEMLGVENFVDNAEKCGDLLVDWVAEKFLGALGSLFVV